MANLRFSTPFHACVSLPISYLPHIHETMTTPAFAGTLSILSPDLTNYGNPPFALVGRGKVNEYSWDHPPLGKLHGRGLHLRCGPASRASTFIYEATGALRYSHALDCTHPDCSLAQSPLITRYSSQALCARRHGGLRDLLINCATMLFQHLTT